MRHANRLRGPVGARILRRQGYWVGIKWLRPRPSFGGKDDRGRGWGALRRRGRSASEVLAAHGPRTAAACVVQAGGHRDLLLAGREVRAGRVRATAVGQPRAVVELQTAVEPVAGVDVPVAAGFAA